MKWFKHYTNAMDDLFMRDLERKFGDSGYAFWFKTLELIGSQGNCGSLEITETNWRQVIDSRRTDHLRRLYAFATERGRLTVSKSKRGIILVHCEKFAEYSDNYTKYGKALQSNFKESSKQEENRIEEDKKKNHNHNTTETILDSQFSDLEEHLSANFGPKGKVGYAILQKYCDLGRKHGKTKLYEAIESAAEYGAYSLAYVRAILEPKAAGNESLLEKWKRGEA